MASEASSRRTTRPRPAIPIIPAVPIISHSSKRRLNSPAAKVQESHAGNKSIHVNGFDTSDSHLGQDETLGTSVETAIPLDRMKDEPKISQKGANEDITSSESDGIPENTPTSSEDKTGSETSSSRVDRPPNYQMPPSDISSKARAIATSSIVPPLALPHAPQSKLPLHHPHPSVGNLIFGGFNESGNPSPVPPQSSPPQFLPSNNPPYLPSAHRAQFHPGHTHHISDPHAHFVPQSALHASFPPPEMMMPALQPQLQPPTRMLEFVTLEDYSQLPNAGMVAPGAGIRSGDSNGAEILAQDASNPGSGVSERGPRPFPYSTGRTSSSAGSDTVDIRREMHQAADAAFQGPGGVTQPPPDPRFRHQQRPSEHSINSAAAFDDAASLLQYLATQFDSPEYADCMFELSSSRARFKDTRFYGHGLMLGRNAFLRNLLRHSESHNGKSSIKMETDDDYVQPVAFAFALRRVYGTPLLNIDNIDQWLSMSNRVAQSPEARLSQRMDFCLAYAAAGHSLKDFSIARRGVETAMKFTNWHTIETAFAFALHGGTDAEWFLNRDPHVTYGDGVPSLTNSAHQTPVSEVASGSERFTNSAPTYEVHSQALLLSALSFIIYHFPADFVLDTSLTESPLFPRLPKSFSHQSRTSISNPRLSGIRFGDFGQSAENPAKKATDILSKLLLSLPFSLVKYIIESPNLGSVDPWASKDVREKTAIAVVAERERRRIHSLQASAQPSGSNLAHEGINREALDWAESVTVIDGRVHLKREWKGA